MTPFSTLVAVSDGDRLTAAEAAELRIEAMFLAGLLLLFVLGVGAWWLISRPCRCDHAQPVEVRHVVVERQAPAELLPRWAWRGGPDALSHDDTPAALPPSPPPGPPARPRSLPAAHRRELRP